MDERAHDGEPTASGRGCGAEPLLRALESMPEAGASGRGTEEDAPSRPVVYLASEVPPAAQLPRAAGGGAGAVAAMVVVAAHEGLAIGDLITQVDDRAVGSVDAFNQALGKAKDKVRLLVTSQRGGSRYVVLPLNKK